MGGTIHLTRPQYDQLLSHARTDHPNECCGLLIGRLNSDAIHVSSVIQATNITAGDATRSYQIDWQSLFDTMRQIRGISSQLVGFYHSHPTGASAPSKRDRENAWPRHGYVIIGRAQNAHPNVAAWLIENEGEPFTRLNVGIA